MFGDAATFSFFGNKTITTGEGGMVVFKDANISERAEILRDHGMQKSKRYWHLEVGYNYDSRTNDGRPLCDHLMDNKLWGEIRREAKTNITLQKALDRVIMIYRLSKDKPL